MLPEHFLTSNFRVAFEEYFGTEQQRHAVDILQEHIAEVRDGTDERRRELGVLMPKDQTEAQIEQRIAGYLDKCYWQLAQLYRYSVPCRIAEAEPYLREMTRHAKAQDRDLARELYLAVAIHKVPGKEQEAAAIFSSAFEHLDDAKSAILLGPRSELWARAGWARLLRRLDRVPEAETQEKAILDWIVSHPLVLSPSKLQALVSDEADSGVLNNITKHPDVLAAIQTAREGPRVPDK